MIAASLQELFRDKDTGLPLRSGYVEFFEDEDRVVPKAVFQLTGSPGAYNYIPLENPVPLTGIGSTSDGEGNDIPWYYYPYDENGELQLYYARIYNSGDVFQFDRQAWPPNAAGSGVLGEDIINYIPNGQFLLHTNIPEADGYQAGEIRGPVTEVAQGNWSFDRTPASSSTDIVTFEEIGGYTSNPSASPRFVFRLQTQVAGAGNSYKDLRVKFSDVNKFTSSIFEQYTYAFEGQVNSGDSSNVSLVLIKNFGAGGSATTEEVIATFTLGASYTIKQASFDFSNNSGKTIGSGSYVSLALRFLTNAIQDVSVVNFILTPGATTVEFFPQTTDKDFVDRSLVPDAPDYDGGDLGLAMLPTLSSAEYDDAVGDIITSVKATRKWHHLCDGSRLLTAESQDTGVPNSRLQQTLWDSTALLPKYGTGLTYATAQVINPNTTLKLHPNTAGAVTAASDGVVPTGFTFSAMAVGATTYGVYSPILQGAFFVWNVAFGAVTAAGAGTSGFTVSRIKRGNSSVAEVSYIVPTVSTGLGGKYFTYVTPSTSYYVWFKVDGTGADPAPGGTGILVNLTSSDNTIQLVANKISNVLSGYEVSLITCTAFAAITADSYFNFNATGGSPTAFYVWYRKDGSGVDPAPGGTGIVVDIVTGDTAAQVCTKTVTAINSLYFAVPDFRGQILRGLDIANNYDSGTRYSFVDGIYGLALGTFELDQLLAHSHDYAIAGGLQPQTGSDTPCLTTLSVNQTGITGGGETRVYNAAVNFFIHY